MLTIDYIIKTLENIVNIPSPSGFTKEVMEYVKKEAEGFGLTCQYSNRGGLLIEMAGRQNEESLLLSAHVDTLGAMVRSITSDGLLRFSLVGGYTMHSVEGSYCKVHTREGKVYWYT